MTLDYGKQSYITNKTTYKDYMKEVTDQSIKSQGAIYQQAGFKQPYLAKDYKSMMYEFSSPLKNLSGLEVPTLDDPYVSIVGIEATPAPQENVIYFTPLSSENDGTLAYTYGLPGTYSFDVTSSTMQTYVSGASYKHGFVRIPKITIPQGVSIISAILYFTIAPGGYQVANYIKINESDNAVAPTDKDSFLALAWSDNQVTLPNIGAAEAITSVDVKILLQEIVNRLGWVSGNAIMFRLNSSSSLSSFFYTYDNGSKYPTLTITAEY